MSDKLNVEDGSLTVVFRYNDFEAFSALPIYTQIFDMMKAGIETDPPTIPPIRVSCIAHDDIPTRYDLILSLVSRQIDHMDLMELIEEIDGAETISAAQQIVTDYLKDED